MSIEIWGPLLLNTKISLLKPQYSHLNDAMGTAPVTQKTGRYKQAFA